MLKSIAVAAAVFILSFDVVKETVLSVVSWPMIGFISALLFKLMLIDAASQPGVTGMPGCLRVDRNKLTAVCFLSICLSFLMT